MIFNSVGDIYEAIDKTRAKLLTVLGSLDESRRQARESEDGWTIAQIAEHLGIVESGMGKIVSRLLKKADDEGLTQTDPANFSVSFEHVISMSKDRKVEAPEIVHPQNTQSFEESLAVLAENRKRIHELRERLEAVDASKHTFPHPFFGDFTAYQWLGMIGLHEMRHLAQIKRILEKEESTNAAAV